MATARFRLSELGSAGPPGVRHFSSNVANHAAGPVGIAGHGVCHSTGRGLVPGGPRIIPVSKRGLAADRGGGFSLRHRAVAARTECPPGPAAPQSYGNMSRAASGMSAPARCRGEPAPNLRALFLFQGSCDRKDRGPVFSVNQVHAKHSAIGANTVSPSAPQPA